MADPCCTFWFEELESIGNYVQEDDGYGVYRRWEWGTDVANPNPLPRDLCGLVLSLFSGGCPSLGEYFYYWDPQWLCPPEGAILNPPGVPEGEYFLFYENYRFEYTRYYNGDGLPTPSPQDNMLAVVASIIVGYRCLRGEPGGEWYDHYWKQMSSGQTGCMGYNSTPSVGCDCCCNCC